jgi:hypothetical protein
LSFFPLSVFNGEIWKLKYVYTTTTHDHLVVIRHQIEQSQVGPHCHSLPQNIYPCRLHTSKPTVTIYYHYQLLQRVVILLLSLSDLNIIQH